MFVALSSGAAIPVTGIAVSPTTASLTTGGSTKFTASVTPTSATNTSVSWSVVPNPDGTGTVDADGWFTADNPGSALVRATAMDGNNVFGQAVVTITPATYFVSSITITAAGNATTLTAPNTLAMSANVQPANATNKTVSWTIVEGTAASIHPTTGVVTGSDNGVVKVQASATDGSGKTSNLYSIEVSKTTGVISIPGTNGTYAGYCYPNNLGCWMTDNSKEGTPSRKRFGYAANETTAETINGTNPSATSGQRGYYYTHAQAADACPSGYHLPDATEWSNLVSYINGATVTTEQKNYWISGSVLAGLYNFSSSTWDLWGIYGLWWSSGATNQAFRANTSGMVGPDTHNNYYFSVRCVKSN
jgi:uncharacterized protein (TIGR02145 family)